MKWRTGIKVNARRQKTFMTDLTLEEVREIAPEQDLLAKLRDDAHLIWGTHKVSHEPARERKSKKKGRLPVWASGFLRLPRLFSWGAPETKQRAIH